MQRSSLQLGMERRGAYGYDAPYALVIFVLSSAATALAAAVSWQQGTVRAALQMTLCLVFVLANTGSFLYATRPASLLSGNEFSIIFILAAMKRPLTWGVAEAQY